MNSYYLEKDDIRGKILYENLLKNTTINEDYFPIKKNDMEELEKLFRTNRYYFSSNTERLKIRLLQNLKKHKLSVYEYFDLVELFFNKYYYGMVLKNDDENKLKKYFTF